MAQRIITFNEVIELNHILEEKGLKFKVHLHDACGKQSFSVEPLGNCGSDGHYEEMNDAVAKYFLDKEISLRFLENQLDFVLVG